MSELAYEADYRARYGCGIDEDPPWPNEDDEPQDECVFILGSPDTPHFADCLDEPKIIPPPL